MLILHPDDWQTFNNLYTECSVVKLKTGETWYCSRSCENSLDHIAIENNGDSS